MKKINLAIVMTVLALLVSNFAWSQSTQVTVDLNKRTGEMKPIWAWFGYDEPNYTYMKDGKKLLSELADLSPVPVFVRTHSLLVSGDGTAALKWGSTNIYTEDAHGNPVYDWTIVDKIFDTYVERGMKPLAQIGFMPEALSTHPQPYRHYWKPGDYYGDIVTGWAYPPKDYDKWRNLVYEWVKHCVERYGKEEVESWWWEVWNEANGWYWKGTQEEFIKLYDYAADGLKKALPTAKIGGINVGGGSSKSGIEWTRRFIEHSISGTNYATGQIGSPMEAILFHAKGSPKLVNGVVQMNMSSQLRDIKSGFEIVRSYPETKDLPVIIGESDPEGCAACGMETNPENAYRNGTMYSSYTAASFARKYELAQRIGVNFLGAVSWSFEFENQPWFYGFRDLYTNGVAKPVLNVFRMYGLMGGDLIEAHSSSMIPLDSICKNSVRGNADIGVLASRREKESAIMVWNYHDNNVTDVPPAEIALNIKGVHSQRVLVSHYRIDENHSNSYAVWKEMGSPQQPTPEQVKELERSGELQMYTSPTWMNVKDGNMNISLELPRQGVSLIKIDWQ